MNWTSYGISRLPIQAFLATNMCFAYLTNFDMQDLMVFHVCLVFEVMGEDLVALARRYSDQKLPIHLVKQISRQLLLGLDYLHNPCKVVHTGHFTLSRLTYQPIFPSRYPTAEHFDST